MAQEEEAREGEDDAYKLGMSSLSLGMSGRKMKLQRAGMLAVCWAGGSVMMHGITIGAEGREVVVKCFVIRVEHEFECVMNLRALGVSGGGRLRCIDFDILGVGMRVEEGGEEVDFRPSIWGERRRRGRVSGGNGGGGSLLGIGGLEMPGNFGGGG